MADNLILDVLYVIKQGSLNAWKESTEIPNLGEICLVVDNLGAYKIGDGENTFSDLKWSSAFQPDSDDNQGSEDLKGQLQVKDIVSDQIEVREIFLNGINMKDFMSLNIKFLKRSA